MKELKVGDIISVKFACNNKNNTLAQYKVECAKPEYSNEMIQVGGNGYPNISDKVRNWSIEKCRIKKIVELSTSEYKVVCESLLDDRKEMFENIGGFDYLGTNEEIINSTDDMLLYKRPDLMKEFKSNMCREGVLLVSGDQYIVIDTQGYNFARYVGFVVNK